jgi:hypothetical protein
VHTLHTHTHTRIMQANIRDKKVSDVIPYSAVEIGAGRNRRSLLLQMALLFSRLRSESSLRHALAHFLLV